MIVDVRNDAGPMELRDSLIQYQELPQWFSGGVLISYNPYPVCIRPYGILIAPHGSYQIPEKLYLPIHIVPVDMFDPERSEHRFAENPDLVQSPEPGTLDVTGNRELVTICDSCRFQ